jgi:hypothetical protein
MVAAYGRMPTILHRCTQYHFRILKPKLHVQNSIVTYITPASHGGRLVFGKQNTAFMWSIIMLIEGYCFLGC